MSLLYECINGVIQGGILEGADGIRDIEEIANLCVSKLREMIMIEGDPNCGSILSFKMDMLILEQCDTSLCLLLTKSLPHMHI